jgi:hypothetical protein
METNCEGFWLNLWIEASEPIMIFNPDASAVGCTQQTIN